MPSFKDLTGNRYGRLLATGRAESRRYRTYFHVLCDCGRKKEVMGQTFETGGTTSCGECTKLEKAVVVPPDYKRGVKRKDISGQRFGTVSVISYAYSLKNCGPYWNCRCDCGHEFVGSGKNLKGSAIRPGQKTCIKCKLKAMTSEPESLGKSRTLLQFKTSARTRGKEWALTDDQALVLLKGNCHYCGTKPLNPEPVSKSFLHNSIDRKDSNGAYNQANTVSCCFHCQWMKNDYSVSEFVSHAILIAKFQASC